MFSAARITTHLLAAAILTLLFCPPLAAQDNPLVQRGVPAEATAENAVLARDRAHASARRIAYLRLMEASGGTTSSTPSDSQLESMVAALIVEEERTTPTRYSGRLTVQFNPGRVASATGRSFSGGGSGGGLALNIPMAAEAYVEASSQHGSLSEWLELRRRLRASGSVAGMEIISLSMDSARYRLGLRQPAAEAAAALTGSGLFITSNGAAWQVSLGAGG
ncbi:hypothetical protein [Sediminicoccus sp. KRV36]|uniref:hypothetical protein n=1 Tax=Sediminicoccus sp. KRV36 TaxID=3133721 RepID=UPI00200F9CF2|nr:hypothetical protein [Sediminicoccus rosea]UPY36011.1 hypothetical protein LHU95_17575 [Sediminicoccus rosea]